MMGAQFHTVLIIGHSFVRRLASDLDRDCIDRAVRSFDLLGTAVHMHGVGGRTVRKLRNYDLNQVAKLKPEIVILEIGSNDLNEIRPEIVGSEIEELVAKLHGQYGVKVIAVSASIHRQNQAADFNRRVDLLNQYLRVVLEPLEFAFFFRHRGLQNPSGVVLLNDGVHLNLKGQYLLYRSYRGAILQSLQLLEN